MKAPKSLRLTLFLLFIVLCALWGASETLFGALWGLVTYLPLLSGPNTPHIFYFVGVGWAIWFACGLLDIAEQARRAGRPQTANTTENRMSRPEKSLNVKQRVYSDRFSGH